MGSLQFYEPALLNSLVTGTDVPVYSTEYSALQDNTDRVYTHTAASTYNFLSFKTSHGSEIQVSHLSELIYVHVCMSTLMHTDRSV